MTVKDCQPLPRIDESLDALSGLKLWSCLDLKSGYWQLDIAEQDRHLTAFSIPGIQWQWKKLAFGLCNAPSTFTLLMQMVFSGKLIFCIGKILYAIQRPLKSNSQTWKWYLRDLAELVLN